MIDDFAANLARNLARMGAPLLGGMIGGPAGTLAAKAIDVLAESLGTPATPEGVGAAVESGRFPAELAAAEATAARLLPLWTLEAERAGAAQAAEIARGFTAWQAARVGIQAVVWGMWPVIALAAMFGGNWGVRPLVPLGEVIGAWGTVTTVWMIVFHGGHTAKEVLPFLRFGGRR
jgi:hypothetical protein